MIAADVSTISLVLFLNLFATVKSNTNYYWERGLFTMVDSLQSTRQTVADHIFEGVKRYLNSKTCFYKFCFNIL